VYGEPKAHGRKGGLPAAAGRQSLRRERARRIIIASNARDLIKPIWGARRVVVALSTVVAFAWHRQERYESRVIELAAST
jgi:hypothetical protein